MSNEWWVVSNEWWVVSNEWWVVSNERSTISQVFREGQGLIRGKCQKRGL